MLLLPCTHYYMTHTGQHADQLLSLVGVSNAVTVQAMNEVAQRMQLRHPNIATVMGVATEPVTEDPLMVSHGTQFILSPSFHSFYIFMLLGVRDTAQSHEAHNDLAHENMHAMFWQSNSHSSMHSETARLVRPHCIHIRPCFLSCSRSYALQHVVCQLVQQGLQLELGYF